MLLPLRATGPIARLVDRRNESIGIDPGKVVGDVDSLLCHPGIYLRHSCQTLQARFDGEFTCQP